MLDALKTSLLDLHHEVAPHSIRLILGGGYGLYLKQHHLQSQSIQTMLDMEIWPEARATNDLDVFLSAEVVTDSTSMGIFRAALEKLGYREIESAKFYQFFKPIGASQHVKLDLLAGPLGKYDDRVKDDPRRVRPRPSVSLHARRVDEALGIEESCTEIDLVGHLSSEATHQATVLVPQPFSYLLMKLFAFRDRKDDEDKDMGRHHALDVLRIVAMMTRQECFTDINAVGMIRIREHQLFRREIDIQAFLGDLHSLLEG